MKEKMTVKESALDLGFVERGEISEEDLDNALNVADMTHPKASK